MISYILKFRLAAFLLLMMVVAISCKKSDDGDPQVVNYSLSGKAQKGPYVTGTTVTMNELGANLAQTGKSFTTSIVSDDGSFSLSNIGLTSPLCLLTATGFYFSEIYGKLSPGMLTLQTIASLDGTETVNINVLTHIIKGRVETLVAGGSSLSQAKTQAQAEMLSFLGVTDEFPGDFSKLDISGTSDYDAILLSFSVILQRTTYNMVEQPLMTAELTELIANLKSDFTPDGLITNQSLIDTLLYNIANQNQLDIRENIEKRYASLGVTTPVPNFEKYITRFQEKHNPNIITEFYYPPMETPDPMYPDAKIKNLLVKTDLVYSAYNSTPLSMAAVIPLNTYLIIKILGPNNMNYGMGGLIYGWKESYIPGGLQYDSQRQNQLMTLLFYLNMPGSATVEYYENSTTPTFSKNIVWN